MVRALADVAVGSAMQSSGLLPASAQFAGCVERVRLFERSTILK